MSAISTIFQRGARLVAALSISIAMGGLATAQDGGTLRYATGTDTQTLDPAFVADVPTSRVVMQIHETLVYPNSAGEMVGVLAESWEVSEDRLTWTFKLRQGVTFHDGTPFNAEAVKFTLDRLVSEDTNSPRASTADAISSIEVVDDYTLVITTQEPYAPLLAQLSAYNLAIVSPAAGKAVNNDYSQAPAGTGPFTLGEWTPGERLTLERNDNYWGTKAASQTIQIDVVPDDTARLLMLMSGATDVVANIPTTMMERLQGQSGIKIIQQTGYRTLYVGLNLAMEPFDDIKVRQAIAHAINTEALISGVMRGIGTPGGGLDSTAIPLAPVFEPYAYDPDLSRQLLAEAGYENGFSVDFYVPSGRYVNDRQLGVAIQAQLAEVGIQVNIISPEFGTFISILDQTAVAPMFLIGKGSPSGDPDFKLGLMVRTGVGEENYANEEVDALIQEQRATLDIEARREVIRKAYELTYQDVPWVVLFYEDQLFGIRDNVEGLVVMPNENVIFANARVTNQ